jgi:hypothetical protein
MPQSGGETVSTSDEEKEKELTQRTLGTQSPQRRAETIPAEREKKAESPHGNPR